MPKATPTTNNLHLYNLPGVIEETGDISILEEIAGMFGYVLVPANGNALGPLEALVKALKDGAER